MKRTNTKKHANKNRQINKTERLKQFYLIPLPVLPKKFLNQYQYISSTRSGNHDVSKAIRKFQVFFGLKVSGILDTETINLMKKPRCGVPDSIEGAGHMRRYATQGKWSKTQLTYYVQPGQDLPHVSTVL